MVKKTGMKVTCIVNYPYEKFRKEIIDNCNDPKVRYLANFHRIPLFYSDLNCFIKITKLLKGHWSPVVAYLEENDLCLVLDVNEEYGGYLIPLERLY